MTRQEGCIFCDIVAEDISADVVYRDRTVLAFLDANPLAPGHTLVIPTDHQGVLTELDEEIASDLGSAIVRVTSAVERAMDADGSTVGFNNGSAAGQAVPHVHCHIIPRHEDDGGSNLHAILSDHSAASGSDADEVGHAIRSELTSSTNEPSP